MVRVHPCAPFDSRRGPLARPSPLAHGKPSPREPDDALSERTPKAGSSCPVFARVEGLDAANGSTTGGLAGSTCLMGLHASSQVAGGADIVAAVRTPEDVHVVRHATTSHPVADAPDGDVAQLGERWLCKPEVRGSNPLVSTIRLAGYARSLMAGQVPASRTVP